MYEPVSQSLRDLAAPGIMLSSSPDEGALVGRVKGSAQPPGRGRLVSRELGEQVVQLAWLPSQHPDRSAQRRLARCPDLTLRRGWAPVGRRGIPATYGPVG